MHIDGVRPPQPALNALSSTPVAINRPSVIPQIPSSVSVSLQPMMPVVGGMPLPVMRPVGAGVGTLPVAGVSRNEIRLNYCAKIID